MKKIEFFGLPCSGKTFATSILKKKITQDDKIVHSHSSAFFEYIYYEKNISISEYLSLKYFKYHKITKKINYAKFNKSKTFTKKKFSLRNPLSNYFYKTYLNLCKKYSRKINFDLKKLIYKKINENDKIINNDKRNAKLWFIEFFAYQYIVEKYTDKIDFVIDDESLYQKIFIFSDMMNNESFLKKYLNLIIKPDLLISVNTKYNKILFRSKQREGTTKFHYRSLKHLTRIIKFEKKLKKLISNRFKIITFHNNNNYLKQINNIYEGIK